MKPTEFHIEFDHTKVVTFNLVDHSLVTAWSYLLMGYWDADDHELEQTNRGFREETYEKAVRKMNELEPHIRKHFSRFPHFTENYFSRMVKPDINREDLNVLHDGYEKLQVWHLEQQDVDNLVPDEVLYAQELNETVHFLERFFKDDMIFPVRKPSPRVRIRMLHEYFKWSSIIMMPYQEKDFDLFELYRPGNLYLTYTKVGKPPLSLFRDHDHHAEEPVPWRLFGPSFNFTLFGPEPVDDFDEARAWLKDNTGRDDWVLGDPKIGTLRGDPDEIWKDLGPHPMITNLRFTYV